MATNVAVAILVYGATGSTRWVAAVTVAQFLPQFLLAPMSGSRADRTDRAAQMLLGGRYIIGGIFVLGAWQAVAGFRGVRDAAVAVLAAGVVGVGFAFGGPALQSLMPNLVRPSELKASVALASLPATLGRIVGPAIGAVFVTSVGALATFGFSVLLQFAFIALIYQAFSGRGRPSPANGNGTDVRLRGILVFFRAERRVRTLLIGVACVGVGIDPLVTLTPALVDDLGATPALVGGLMSVFGTGSGLAVALLGPANRRLRARTLGPMGLAVLSLSLVGLAFANSLGAAVVAAGFAGLGMTIAISSYTALLHFLVPDQLRGRLTAVWSMAFLGARPIAAIVSGVIADSAGVRAALLVAVSITALGAFLSRPSRLSPRDAHST
jgi:MFS family permease